jgi:dipeptidyl aminopeptidase/acylaminoacyl peptidase
MVKTKTASWSPSEILKLKILSDVQISPDNKTALFVAAEAVMNEEKSAYISRIYKATNGEAAVPFSTPDSSATLPRWSPDGKWIAFLLNRDKVKNLYLIRADGGEATALTQSKVDVQTFAWSPDSKKIAFVMADETQAEKKRKKTSAAYVYNEKTKVTRLWIVDTLSPKRPIRPLTSDAYCVRGTGDFGTNSVEFDWSPDGKKIAFAHSPDFSLDNFYLESSIAVLDVRSGSVTRWKNHAPFEAMPRYSPDGRSIAYISGTSEKRYAMNRRVAVRPKNGGRPQLLAETFNGGPFLTGPNILGWSRDGKRVLFFEPKGTKYHIVALSKDGKKQNELKTGDCFFKDPSLSPDRTALGFIVQSSNIPPEVHLSKLDRFRPVKVSSLNKQFLSNRKLKTEIVHWNSSDGLKIEGLLTYPPNYRPGKKYPFLLVIHGGPMGFFDEFFLGSPYPYPLASFAEAGFIVFRPNPRGSTGYGKTFRCANYNDWGGKDFADIMSGVDAMIQKEVADPKKLGVMGWSYGGYMTAWTITQTQRFKAASMGAGLSDLVSMSLTTDLDRFFSDYLGPFNNQPEFYHKRSPIYYIAQVSTPCLIQHGTEDKRVPASQSYEFYHALERAGKKTTLVLYPETTHRIIDPKMVLDSMERNLAWFKHHIL